ncbi:hypothetical protein SPRG_05489 [Saprolegnia parasitica CBS 223.65]|uniref:OTU domain-containing protein n=1 Tax=Saprolegnia parasitica (strain CBS 223.65) TaxID=695850 RepID=A0A067CG91_SAPPC|nr:hypothetical protein SPRG_05489 [Saprolegnia parasitica CBS 223.65]KDO29533.1 hypothetical protein SPRG_05489 [Saprolegnia parasitica CBS 223.65]|eukprot:XP_012199598.1 hypothetical protein SPRG_05489 [Saprolegnia parasitica CBS 223.65]
MEADGNCLFRALSDQLHGDQTHFPVIRKDIVQYIKDHQDDLEPFMEDEEAFDHYCSRMADDGVWGGNLELYVASLLWQRHIVVHQVDGNRTTIDCGHAKARAWHVCYYNDEHYDSIRSVDDDLMSTPLPLPLPVTEGKICVETGVDTSAQRERDLKALRTDFPTMDTDELESLFEQLQCDPAKVRQKLSAKTKKVKHMVKMKKRR